MIKCCDFLLAVTMLALVSVAMTSPLYADRCRHVHQSLAKFAPTHRHHSHPIRDICGHRSGSSCCTGLEVAIESKTREHFSGQITSHLGQFRAHFAQRENRIHQRLNSILNETMERINQTQSVRIALASAELVRVVRRNVFGRNQHQVSTKSYLDMLLNAIVISELERSHTITPDYANCLSSVNFGDVFSQMLTNLSRDIHTAIETSRLILQSLQVTSELLQRAEGVQLSESCVRHLAADQQCALCLDRNSTSGTRLCAGACEAAVGQCVASSQLGLVHETWHSLSRTIRKLVDSVLEHRNPETIFARFPTLVEQALEQARSKNEIAKKARLSCGPMERNFTQGDSHKLNGGLYHTKEPYSSYSESLFISIETMAHLFEKNKDLFSNLPQKFCQQAPDKDCLDSGSLISSNSAVALPLMNQSINYSDEFFEIVKRFQASVEFITHSRLKLSNRTAHSLEDEDPNSPNSVLQAGSGSGDGDLPDDEEEEEEDDEPSSSGENPDLAEPSSTARTSTTDSGIGFESTTYATPTTTFSSTFRREDPDLSGKSGSSSLATGPCKVVLLVAVLVLWRLGLRHRC